MTQPKLKAGSTTIKPRGMYILSILPDENGFDFTIIRANGCTISGHDYSLTQILDRIREVIEGEVSAKGKEGKW
jgi:hypothetical protein